MAFSLALRTEAIKMRPDDPSHGAAWNRTDATNKQPGRAKQMRTVSIHLRPI
jgi:hypothetical protein